LSRDEDVTATTCPASSTPESLPEAPPDAIRLPLVAEELRATSQSTNRGPVRVQRRIVHESSRTERVEETDEILVSRGVVTRPGPDGAPNHYERIVVDIPLPAGITAPNLDDQGAEEIVVTHEIVHRTEYVTGHVRRENVTVTASGEIDRVPIDGQKLDPRDPDS
jgi:stress response protein YsnF